MNYFVAFYDTYVKIHIRLIGKPTKDQYGCNLKQDPSKENIKLASSSDIYLVVAQYKNHTTVDAFDLV